MSDSNSNYLPTTNKSGRAFQYLNQLGDLNSLTPKAQAEKIFKTRISERPRVSSEKWLDTLLRERILDLGHIDNSMYLRLLANDLSTDEWERFFTEYFWGSSAGFQRVLAEALKVDFGQEWRTYIESIIREESKPVSHPRLLSDALAAVDISIRTQGRISSKFVEAQVAGYQRSRPYSFGYAMGIEVEADYQISLLAVSVQNIFPGAISSSEWFDIHMDQEGEQMHAEMTCRYIESLCRGSQQDTAAVEEGFCRAIVDTRVFMESLDAQLC